MLGTFIPKQKTVFILIEEKFKKLNLKLEYKYIL